MKSKFMILIALAVSALMLPGCSEYDDTDVKNQIEDLNGRVTKLEELASQMNTNISSLLTAVQALQNEDRIVSVTPLEDGSGYTVVFSKSGTITIYNGKDGETPVISVKLADDGQYYWTLGSDYLLDDQGNKIPATSKTEIPQIRVNDGNFELSFDGENWQNIGSAGGAGLFKDVLDGEDSVTFVLSDGSTIVIPKVQSFKLNFSKTEYAISAGSSVTVQYSVSSADDETAVNGFATNGFTAEFDAVNTSVGTVKITAPSQLGEEDTGQVFVFAVNANGEVAGKVLTFGMGIFFVDTENVTPVPADGGTVTLPVFTNQDYTVSIPSDVNWITYTKTKALEVRDETITITVEKNYVASVRTAEISVIGELGDEYKVTIVQEAGTGEKEPGYYNSIEDWVYDDDTIKF